MHGVGTLVRNKNGFQMKGTFVEGKLEGPGERIYASGKKLTGEWQDNFLVSGKLINVDGTTYEGEWVGGRPHGEGVKTISTGKRYEGMFSLGRPWGKGAKVDGDKKQIGHWDKVKFIRSEPLDHVVQSYRE